MKMQFRVCEICGNIMAVVNDSGIIPVCCGQQMKELVPNTVDAATEKHVPQITVKDNYAVVAVGEFAHPMNTSHYIEWIAIETNKGNQRKALKPGDEPLACFALCSGEQVIRAYAFCNLHGLWMDSPA